MFGDGLAIHAKQLGNLRLRQPNGLVFKLDIQANLAIG